MTHRICRIPGDGIGHDVMEATCLVLEKLGLDIEWVDAEAGWCCWEKYGNTVPEQTWRALEETECCLFGAITSKSGIPGFKSAILQVRQHFDLACNIRPIKAYKGVSLNYRDDIDMVIFRENTEGLYSGVEWDEVPDELFDLHPSMERFRGKQCAASLRIFTREGCERICRAAFEYAAKNGRKNVSAIHKANVIRETDGMFLDVAREVAKDYPDIEMWEANVDAMAMWLIKQPQIYDVLVTTNMFGDIISDEAAQLVGGLGFACSANVGATYALFEPSHGSAPKYAGQYKVNPMAMLLSTVMMLDWLGEADAARRFETAIARVLEEGKVKTYDLGGSNTTLEVAEEVARVMESQ
jgi:isopropylmalate/isohomocitrate dehydrogenase-like protein